MNYFEEIIGYESLKETLNLIVDYLKNRKKFSELGVKRIGGLLLYGAPGLGKTSICNSIIKCCNNRKVYVIKKNLPDGEFVRCITKTFEEAKVNAPSIILLDDFDKFSNNDSNHTDTEEYATLQSSIDDVKDCDVFILATANDICDVPFSLLRSGRFDKTIEILPPSKSDSEKIFKHYLSQKSYISDINIHDIVNLIDGLTCAELEGIVNDAGLYAGFRESEKIENEDIIKAILNRIEGDETSNKEDPSEKYKKLICTHEAAHACVSEILNRDSVALINASKYEKGIGGYTYLINSDDYFYDVKEMENRVVTLLAGRAATEVFENALDTGCEDDIRRAYYIVSRIICSYAKFDLFDFNGRGYSYDKYDEVTDKKIKDVLKKYYNKACKIVKENAKFIQRISDELYNKKILLSNDLKRIRDEYLSL